MCSSEGKDLLTLHGQGTDVLVDTSYEIGNCSILFQKNSIRMAGIQRNVV